LELGVLKDASLPQQGLPKKKRLLKRSEFQVVFERGRRHHGRYLLLASCHNDLGFSRLGISVSKKMGKAYVRNRVKRHIRDAFRRTPGIDSLSRDFVVVLNRRGECTDFASMRNDIWSLIDQLK
jgi:ribonuclease P protein component